MLKVQVDDFSFTFDLWWHPAKRGPFPSVREFWRSDLGSRVPLSRTWESFAWVVELIGTSIPTCQSIVGDLLKLLALIGFPEEELESDLKKHARSLAALIGPVMFFKWWKMFQSDQQRAGKTGDQHITTCPPMKSTVCQNANTRVFPLIWVMLKPSKIENKQPTVHTSVGKVMCDDTKKHVSTYMSVNHSDRRGAQW